MMNPAPNSAGLRFTLLVAVIVALLIGALLSAGHRYWRGVLHEHIDAHLSSVASSRRDMVQARIAQLRELAVMNADRGEFRSYLGQLAAGTVSEKDRAFSQHSLNRMADGNPIRSAALVDAAGRIVISSKPGEAGRSVADDPGMTAMEPRIGLPVGVEKRFETEVSAPVMAFAPPDRKCGMLLLEVDVGPLAAAIRDATGLGETGEVLLGVREGEEIRYLFPARYRSKVLRLPLAAAPAMAAATAGTGELLAHNRDYRGEPVLACGRTIGYGGWGLVAKMDEAEAYAPIARALRYGMSLGALVGAVGLAAYYNLARQGLMVPGHRTIPLEGAPHRVARICAAAVLLAGLAGLACRGLKIDPLKTVLPGLAPMQPNAAVCFLLAGAALWLRERRAVRFGCALAILAFAGISLARDLGGKAAGAGWFPFPGVAAAAALPDAARMSTMGAVNFLLIAGALLLLGTRSTVLRRTLEALALLAGSAALVSLIGHAYDVNALYRISGFASISLHAAMAFVVLVVGILAARPDGLAGVFASAGLGGHVARRFLPLAIAAPVVLGWLALMGQDAGLLDAASVTAVFAASMILVLAVLVWWNALSLEASEAERTDAAKKLGEREALLRTLTDHARVGMVMVTAERRYAFANAAYAEVLGLSEKDIAGRRVADVLAGVYESQIRPRLDRAFAGERVDCEMTMPPREAGEGGQCVAMTYDPPVETAHGPCVIVVVVDITERQRAEEALRQFNAELEKRVRDRTVQYEEANRDLESFSYSVSHDLRAPLRAINGFARILVDDYGGRLDEEGRRVTSVVSSEALRMGRLIDALLEFSRLGRKAVARDAIDMQALAREAFAESAAAEQERDIAFRLAALPPAQGDATLLRQVFVNLFSNAVKFTRRRADAAVEAGARIEAGRVVYWVRDNGAGFDQRYANRLFGVFQRLHRQDEFEGTGVGLAFVQRILQRHGGRIWAEGAPGDGATFYFSLPSADGGKSEA